jgi:hypothetical protein
MKRWSLFLSILTLLAFWVSAEPAGACPLCKEAIDNASKDDPQDDPFREARAWNQSIYLMVGMPYFLLGSLGLLIYREYRKKVRAEQQTAGGRGAGGGEDLSCSGPFHAGTS